MAKELFYSSKEKILFLITGYDNPTIVEELITTLKEGKAKIIKAGSPYLVKEKDVKTDMIHISRRYKSMRYYWVPLDKKPKDAFELGPDWTMHQWISN